MKNLLLRLALVASLTLGALAPLSASAQDHGDGEAAAEPGGTSFVGGPDWDDAKEVTIWSLVGIGVFSTLMGVLYLFKRKVGGFPEHPSWVAPISVMPASELPGDDGDSHAGHDSHGTHAPAH
jgi:hypothetical protein